MDRTHTRRQLFRALGAAISKIAVGSYVTVNAADSITRVPWFWERWPLLDALLTRFLALFGR